MADVENYQAWIQQEQVADDLMALGVPREDIVLGFHPPICENLRSLP